MVELTRFEDKLIDEMQEVYNDAVKGVSLLRMFISHYDFDMREASENTIYHIRGNWENAGQVLYAITDYFEAIEERLDKVLCSDFLYDLKQEYSEPQETDKSSSKEELCKEAAEMLEEINLILSRIENLKILEYFYQFIRTAVTMWK